MTKEISSFIVMCGANVSDNNIPLDIIALILSGLAILVSFKQNNKLQFINMEANYYSKIFDEYLITRIPKARSYIRFDNNNHLVDAQKLVDELSCMRTDALYFRYANSDFYSELKKYTQDIEDYVMQCGNNTFEAEEQYRVYSTIQEKIENLYKSINTHYTGKRKRNPKKWLKHVLTQLNDKLS